MATRNIQMNILTDSGSYDTLYPQTTATQAGARPSTWMPSASDVGARPSTWTPTASQVGALPITGGTLTGDLKIKNSSNYGTTLSFGDGTYCQISEPVDDCMDIKAKKVNFTISDTSDSRFTINNINPFGANGDFTGLIYETGSRSGTGTAIVGSSFNISFSKITTLCFLIYFGINRSEYWSEFFRNYPQYEDNNINISVDSLNLINTFFIFPYNTQKSYILGTNNYKLELTYKNSTKQLLFYVDNNGAPENANAVNRSGTTYYYTAIGY